MDTDLNVTVYAWDGVYMEALSALYDLYKVDGTYYKNMRLNKKL